MPDNITRINLVSTGEEILRGEVLDTNACFASELLDDNGFAIGRRFTCSDDLDDLIDTLSAASENSHAVIVCGGLGPTVDDRTVEALAKLLDTALVTDEKFLEKLRSQFKKMGLHFGANQARQARLPAGASLIANPHGTAPGICATRSDGGLFFCLPGPPREFKPMMTEQVIFRLHKHMASLGHEYQTATRTIRAFGGGEGFLAEKLGDLESEIKNLQLGFRAAIPEIHIKLRVSGLGPDEAIQALDRAEDLLMLRIGKYVFSSGKRTMAQVVLDLLKCNDKTLAIAESCTGGLVAKLLTDVPGSSQVLTMSAVTYSSESKSVMLNVPKKIIEDHGAVSQQCVKAMARGVRALADSSMAIAITGIAGPGGGTEEKPVGTVWFALADENTCTTTLKSFPNFGRESLRSWAAHYALDIVRRALA